jgi:predicted metalloprotease with PDZ domain
MSRSSPGRYALHEFAKNVFDVHAFDERGAELGSSGRTRTSGTCRSIRRGSASLQGVRQPRRRHVPRHRRLARAHEHAGDPDVGAWTRRRPGPRDVRASERLSWKPATQLFPTDDPWTFTAPNLQYLMDSPTELSNQSFRSFTVRNADGKQFTIRTAVHHDATEADIDEYAAATEKIVREHGAVFGEFPEFDGGTYTFLGDYVPWGGGDGMEHRNSTVVAEGASIKGNVRGVLGTVSHEFFHAWNVERIRPKTLEPFSFEDANMSGELWLAEGFTQYYGQLIMARAGLSAGEQTLLSLANSALGVASSPAHRFRSAVEMSEMAPFTDAARANDPTNFGYSFINYYPYGSALALALDLSLRQRSGGKVTLDDYMRGMWRVHGKPAAAPGYVERPYTLADARARLAEVSDRAFADDFFSRYIEGREVPDYARLLDAAGVTVRPRSTDAWTGAAIDASGRVTALRGMIDWGTPAFEAGLEHEDVLISVDGQPFSAALLKDRKPGDRVTFEVKHRGGVTGKGTLTFGADPARQAVLNESAGKPLTAEQKAFVRRGSVRSAAERTRGIAAGV